MKSLILKDLYNISHNSKVILVMLLWFALTILPQSSTESYIVICCLLCSMMVVTTFSYDENSKWVKYALILPLSKKDYVRSKFIILLIFSLIGAAFGLVFGSVVGIVLHKFTGSFMEALLSQLFMTLIGLAISVTFGSFTIPLLFKYGAEKARMMMLLSFGLPAVLFLGIYKLLDTLGIPVTDQTFVTGLRLTPFAAILIVCLMYKISFAVFQKKELNS